MAAIYSKDVFRSLVGKLFVERERKSETIRQVAIHLLLMHSAPPAKVEWARMEAEIIYGAAAEQAKVKSLLILFDRLYDPTSSLPQVPIYLPYPRYSSFVMITGIDEQREPYLRTSIVAVNSAKLLQDAEQRHDHWYARCADDAMAGAP